MTNKAADFDEARWRRLTDARALGQSLAANDEQFLDRFSPRSDAAVAEAELFSALDALGGAADDTADEADEEAANSPLVEATVQHVLAAQQPREVGSVSPVASPSPWRRWGAWMVVGLAAAAALALWVDRPSATPTTPSSDRIAEVPAELQPEAETAAPAPSTVAPEVDPAPPALAFTRQSGELLDAEGSLLSDSAALSGVVEVRSERACIALGEVSSCMDKGARVDLHTGDEPAMSVEAGEVTIVATPAVVGAVVVTIAGDRYTVSSPVTIESHVYSRKAAKVEVVAGQVELTDAQGERLVLRAGDVRGRARAARAVPVPDAKTLLSQAHASRSAGDKRAAISHYEKLLKHYSDTPKGRAAMVSLGDLYLDARKPKSALEWFDRYLAHKGGLAQEAHIGRIKALGALGRSAEQAKAIEVFSERYPSSRYAEQFRRRTP